MGDERKMDDRTRKLRNCFKGVDEEVMNIIDPMIDDVVFLENKLSELKELPFINVNPKNIMQQKATPASKMYKEFLQQYNNCIKIMCGVLNKNGIEEESPLREWLKQSKGM